MFGLIFDMDGVLVDSAEPHYQSWRLLADELGQHIDEPSFRATFGRQNRDIIPLVFDRHDPAEVERLSRRKEALYRDLIVDHVPGIDGAVELVRAAHACGFKLAIGSSGPPENVNLVLDGMGIADCFDVRITSEQATRGKPDPQVFQLAAKGLDLDPKDCAVVEDAPAGVEAALRAGAVAIALVNGHPAESLREAHCVVDSLRTLDPERIAELIRHEQCRSNP